MDGSLYHSRKYVFCSILDQVKSIADVYGRDWCNILFLASIDFKINYAALWVMTYFVLYIHVPFLTGQRLDVIHNLLSTDIYNEGPPCYVDRME